LADRSNQEWITALSAPGPGREAALADLRALLVRGLGYALANRSDVNTSDQEDFAQDALLKILDGLESFRGESRFTTWAQKIAVHVAFSELRRRRWRDVSLDGLVDAFEGSSLPRTWVDPDTDTEQQAVQRETLETLTRLIADELTDKQRKALVAVRVHGMPIAEVARKMGVKRNALYKLLFDARQRLKSRLLEKGFSIEEMLAAFDVG
jgi:RNA polymerase sigma-70 factor (ECF subfamily)